MLLPKVTSVNQLRLGAAAPGRVPSNQSHILTGDENLVEAEYAVFWKVQDAGRYLFGMSDPEGMLRTAAEGALRDVIGRNPILSALSDKRQQIADDIAAVLQRSLDAYGAGIAITQVQLQRVDPPNAVIDDFNDVQRARADQERARNEAEAYRNDVIPRARAEANRVVQEAEAYRDQVVSVAEGATAGFLDVYKAYRGAPDVTAWRMYLDSVDELLRRASKVVIDTSGKGVASTVPYLSLSDGKAAPAAAAVPPPPPPTPKPAGATP